MPPRSTAGKSASEPSSLPIGVRAPPTITEPGMADTIRRMTTPQLTRIDHVGIACRDLEASIAHYTAAFGLTLLGSEINEEQGIHEAMLHVADAPGGFSSIQLLEPLRADSPVGRFLDRHGEGVHHIAYGVEDITAAL